MPIIKRYANRKLYDTEAKRYIKLDGIAELIRRGEEVHVVDHETGADLTPQIQAQIIFEEEKHLRGGLPRTVLTGLIRTGSETIQQLRQALAPGFADQVDIEIERRMARLVETGLLPEPDGARLRDLLLSARELVESPDWPAADEMQRALVARGAPSRTELRQFAQQLEQLTAEIEQITNQTAAPRAPRRAARKSPGQAARQP